MTATTSVAAELRGVSVSYDSPDGEVQALADTTFACMRGASTAIVGRSGSGKSTLISVLSLLRRPSHGQVWVGGVEASSLGQRGLAALRARHVGIVFQAFHLEHSLSVVDNVMLGWNFSSQALGRREAVNRAREDLERLGIGDLADRHPHALSGGQRQRVAIARAIFSRPTLLVADEPTGNLDESTAGDVAQLLLSLPVEHDTAVVMVTHDETIAALADARRVITAGRISP